MERAKMAKGKFAQDFNFIPEENNRQGSVFYKGGKVYSNIRRAAIEQAEARGVDFTDIKNNDQPVTNEGEEDGVADSENAQSGTVRTQNPGDAERSESPASDGAEEK